MTTASTGNEPIELSVIVLCYRAEDRVRVFVPQIQALLEQNAASWELILVGNYFPNVPDRTPQIVHEMAADPRVIAVTLPKAGMFGWDVRRGLERARGRYLCYIDGDEQMPWQDIVRVFQKIKEGGLDFVLTWRTKRHDGFFRRMNSRFFNLLTRALFPGIKVRDINAKPKIFTREAYQRMNLTENGWCLDAEMMIQGRRLGFRTAELPTEFFKCNYRRSFVRVGAILEFLWNLFKFRVREFRRSSS